MGVPARCLPAHRHRDEVHKVEGAHHIDIPGTGDRAGWDKVGRAFGLLRNSWWPERCSPRVWPAEERLR